MTAKQHIDHLIALVRREVPDVRAELDAPDRAGATWFVDLRSGDQALVVEYRPRLGFGLSTPSADAYGEGPDEYFPDEELAARRVVELIRTRRPTEPQRVRMLQELREQRRVSQVALAARLGVRQPTVSKLERREDVALSTLRRYVAALGGVLHVTAQFADGRFEIDLDDEVPA